MIELAELAHVKVLAVPDRKRYPDAPIIKVRPPEPGDSGTVVLVDRLGDVPMYYVEGIVDGRTYWLSYFPRECLEILNPLGIEAE